jgi:membrane protease YdiL (CAAX protease family)
MLARFAAKPLLRMPPPLSLDPARRSATLSEAFVVVAICFGVFIAASLAAMAGGFRTADGSGFSDAAFAHMIRLELVLGALALWWLHRRGWRPADLLPWPTWRGSAFGAALCVVALLAWYGLNWCVNLGDYAAQPIAQMLAAARPSPMMVVLASALNGVYEETFLVGYLVRGFSDRGPAAAIGVSVLVRLLYHVYQGPIGALAAVVFGCIVGLFYWRTRLLWPVAFAHMLQDIVSLSYSG